MRKQILFVFGTRPEAIKLAPLIKKMSNEEKFLCKVCSTGQHDQMLNQALDFFKIKLDFDLHLMRPNQSLGEITVNVIAGVEKIIKTEFAPDFLIVQGDTTSAFCGALAAFYSRIKVVHIEAGFRSFDKNAPFPEEINRKFIGSIASIHFAPTERCVTNLLDEGIDKKFVWNVGNTVIDALLLGLETIKKNEKQYEDFFKFLDSTKKIILVTGHRRENFGQPIRNICNALKIIARNNLDYEIVYPLHLNPNSRGPVLELLEGFPGIHLIEPLDYSNLIWLLNRSKLVITDSGGIQEEAATLSKPVLIIRHITERMEGVENGTAKLVGTNLENIVYECERLINDESSYDMMSKKENPYGDGTSCEQIMSVFDNICSNDFVQLGPDQLIVRNV